PAAAAEGTEPSAANDATPAARIPVTAPAASPRYVLQGRGAAALAANGCTARHAFISPSSEKLSKVCGSITGERRGQRAPPRSGGLSCGSAGGGPEKFSVPRAACRYPHPHSG